MSYTCLLMEVSVVIPTLNEAAHIGALLERLSCMRGVGEVVVADGGWTDDTPELVVSSATRLVRERPGREGQLNAGARAASGDVLLSCTPTSRRRTLRSR